jgi:hypothetical protein
MEGIYFIYKSSQTLDLKKLFFHYIPYELLVLEETITKMDKSFNMFLKMVGNNKKIITIISFFSLMIRLLEWAIEKKM